MGDGTRKGRRTRKKGKEGGGEGEYGKDTTHLRSNPHKRMRVRSRSHSVDGYANAAVCTILEANREGGAAESE